MPLSTDILDQLRHVLRPYAVKIANLAARATIQMVDDSAKMQLVQLGSIVGGPYPGAEHFQPYGFSSVPRPGPNTQGLVLFPNGDRSHPLVFSVADRSARPTEGDPGDVTMHHFSGATIKMTEDGDIVATPAAGRHVLIDDGSGSAALPTLAEFNSHTHPAPGGATSTPTTPATGTTVFKAR